MARNRIAQTGARAMRSATGRNVAGTLTVAAGYGLAISALTVLTVERMFGTRSPGGRLEVLGMTVGTLVIAAAVMCARRSRQRRPRRRG
jgi:hypothetical protein